MSQSLIGLPQEDPILVQFRSALDVIFVDHIECLALASFPVMAGLVPAIGRGTLPLQMAGTGPATTVTAGFSQGGSASAGRCELAMTEQSAIRH
jgi:hypothetical protein